MNYGGLHFAYYFTPTNHQYMISKCAFVLIKAYCEWFEHLSFYDTEVKCKLKIQLFQIIIYHVYDETSFHINDIVNFVYLYLSVFEKSIHIFTQIHC